MILFICFISFSLSCLSPQSLGRFRGDLDTPFGRLLKRPRENQGICPPPKRQCLEGEEGSVGSEVSCAQEKQPYFGPPLPWRVDGTPQYYLWGVGVPYVHSVFLCNKSDKNFLPLSVPNTENTPLLTSAIFNTRLFQNFKGDLEFLLDIADEEPFQQGFLFGGIRASSDQDWCTMTYSDSYSHDYEDSDFHDDRTILDSYISQQFFLEDSDSFLRPVQDAYYLFLQRLA